MIPESEPRLLTPNKNSIEKTRPWKRSLSHVPRKGEQRQDDEVVRYVNVNTRRVAIEAGRCDRSQELTTSVLDRSDDVLGKLPSDPFPDEFAQALRADVFDERSLVTHEIRSEKSLRTAVSCESAMGFEARRQTFCGISTPRNWAREEAMKRPALKKGPKLSSLFSAGFSERSGDGAGEGCGSYFFASAMSYQQGDAVRR